jgi:hypothetical protein
MGAAPSRKSNSSLIIRGDSEGDPGISRPFPSEEQLQHEKELVAYENISKALEDGNVDTFQRGYAVLIARSHFRGSTWIYGSRKGGFKGCPRAIHTAVQFDFKDIVRFMVAQGANLDESDYELKWPRSSRMDNGPSSPSFWGGRTPLYYAMEKNDIDMVKILLEGGAGADFKTFFGYPIELANKWGFNNIVALIKQHTPSRSFYCYGEYCERRQFNTAEEFAKHQNSPDHRNGCCLCGWRDLDTPDALNAHIRDGKCEPYEVSY